MDKKDKAATLLPEINPFVLAKRGRPPGVPNKTSRQRGSAARRTVQSLGTLVPGLVRRGGMYYFRQRVPTRVVKTFGRKEVLFSLGTSDIAHAMELAKLKRAEFLKQFEDCEVSYPAVFSPPSYTSRHTTITPELLAQIEQLAFDNTYHGSLIMMREFKGEIAVYEDGTVIDLEKRNLDAIRENFDAARRRDKLHEEYDIFDCDQMLEARHINIVTENQLEREPVYQAYMAGKFKAYERLLQHYELHKNFDEVPWSASSLSLGISGRGQPTLKKICEAWLNDETKPKARTTRFEGQGTFKDFEQIVGNRLISDIRPDDVRRLQQVMRNRGNSPATINKKVGLLKAMFSYAVETGVIDVNPIANVKPVSKIKKAATREEFDEHQYKLFFSTAPFDGRVVPASHAEAHYWIPLLLAYTGARVGEIAKLMVDEVKTVTLGTYITIRDDEGTVKNESSIRVIPLHEDLIALGFKEFCDKQKALGKKFLFESLPVNSTAAGTRGATFSKYMTRRLDALGLKGKRVTLHSLRHNFKTFCRDSDIPAEIHDRLTGHSSVGFGKNAGNSYGTTSLQTLFKAIGQLKLEYMPKLKRIDLASAKQLKSKQYNEHLRLFADKVSTDSDAEES